MIVRPRFDCWARDSFYERMPAGNFPASISLGGSRLANFESKSLDDRKVVGEQNILSGELMALRQRGEDPADFVAVREKAAIAATIAEPGAHKFGSIAVDYYRREVATRDVRPEIGDTAAFIDGERRTSDGYLIYSGQTRDNLMAEVVRPLGDKTSITVCEADAGWRNAARQDVSARSACNSGDLHSRWLIISKSARNSPADFLTRTCQQQQF